MFFCANEGLICPFIAMTQCQSSDTAVVEPSLLDMPTLERHDSVETGKSAQGLSSSESIFVVKGLEKKFVTALFTIG